MRELILPQGKEFGKWQYIFWQKDTFPQKRKKGWEWKKLQQRMQ